MRAMTSSVRKAVFPAAGLGTRFLPATKAQPKEMLPLVDKPIIQYGVEEAVASGVDNIILVTGRGKNAIEDHFDVSVELETFLEARGKTEQLEEVRKISNMINFAYVRQGEPLGLGHAVLVTRDAGRRRTVRRHPRRRCDRCGSAGDQAADRRVRTRSTDRCSPSNACRRDEISNYGVIAPDTTVDLGAGHLPHRGSRREAAEARSAVRSGDHRPLHPHARHFSGAGRHQERSHRRNPADQRSAGAAEDAADLRLRGQRRPPRHRATSSDFSRRSSTSRLRRPDLADKFSAYLRSLGISR